MTAKTVEDLFLADELREVAPSLAGILDRLTTHEDVEAWNDSLGKACRALYDEWVAGTWDGQSTRTLNLEGPAPQ